MLMVIRLLVEKREGFQYSFYNTEVALPATALKSGREVSDEAERHLSCFLFSTVFCGNEETIKCPK